MKNPNTPTPSTSAPSFKGLVPASRLSSEVKAKNRSEDTAHELLLRKLLWRRGLRFRKNVKSLPGKPDIVFPKYKLVIFCDGDFWHGREWETLSGKLERGTNSLYWLEKVRSNRERDLRNSSLLRREGWTVLRYWESEILHSPEIIADQIGQKIHSLASPTSPTPSAKKMSIKKS